MLSFPSLLPRFGVSLVGRGAGNNEEGQYVTLARAMNDIPSQGAETGSNCAFKS